MADNQQKRVALVVGNARYSVSGQLRNPPNDARAISDALISLGFDVLIGVDLTCHQMEELLAEFDAKANGADAALFYFAGHGMQVRGENYLLPTDASISEEWHLNRRAFALSELLRLMVRRADSSIVILDACRENPFSRSLIAGLNSSDLSRGIVRSGLAEVKAARGSFIAFATAPDNLADDGNGQHSPFTEALLAHIATENVSIGDMMIDVRSQVLRNTFGRQEPWDQSSLRSRFFFNKSVSVVDNVTSKVSEIASPDSLNENDMLEWMAVSESVDPSDFENFKKRFPQSSYIASADQMLNASIQKCADTEILKKFTIEHASSDNVDACRKKLKLLDEAKTKSFSYVFSNGLKSLLSKAPAKIFLVSLVFSTISAFLLYVLTPAIREAYAITGTLSLLFTYAVCFATLVHGSRNTVVLFRISIELIFTLTPAIILATYLFKSINDVLDHRFISPIASVAAGALVAAITSNAIRRHLRIPFDLDLFTTVCFCGALGGVLSEHALAAFFRERALASSLFVFFPCYSLILISTTLQVSVFSDRLSWSKLD